MKSFPLDKETLSETITIIKDYKKNSVITNTKLKMVFKITKFSQIFYFDDFYIISYFNRYFIFDLEIKYDNATPLESFIEMNAKSLIIEDQLIEQSDFENLKKCYMLTKKIVLEDGEIYCSYSPHYLIKLTLYGKILHIYINNINMETQINMNNVETDLKTFLKDIFKDFPQENKKMHYLILEFYANT